MGFGRVFASEDVIHRSHLGGIVWGVKDKRRGKKEKKR
jgi:hypothetical protein